MFYKKLVVPQYKFRYWREETILCCAQIEKAVQFLRVGGVTVSDHELAVWSLIVAVVASASAIIAVIVAARARKEAKEIAVAQKVFDAPALDCSLLSADSPHNLIVATKIEDGRINELQLPLHVRNKGTKVAENVSVYIRIPEELVYGNAFALSEDTGDASKILKVTVALLRQENFGTIALSIPRLQPYQHLYMSIPFSVRHSTEINSEVRATTADDIRFSMRYRVFFKYVMNIFIACEGSTPTTLQYNLEILDISKKSLVEVINERSATLKSEYESNRRRLGLLARARHRIKYILDARSSLQKILIIEFRENGGMAEEGSLIKRYNKDKAVLYEGSFDNRDGTYWVPSLGTTVFGAPSKAT